MTLSGSFHRLQILSKPDLVRACSLAVAIWGPVFGPILLFAGLPWAALASVLSAVAVAMIGWYQSRTSSTRLTSNLMALFLYLSVTSITYTVTGDLLEPWLILVPVLATMLGSILSGAVWTVFLVCHVVVHEQVKVFWWWSPADLSAQTRHTLEVLGLISATIVIVVFVALYERFRREALAGVQSQHRALQEAWEEIQWLQELLPICMHCRRVRDENADWQGLEHYLDSHSRLRFSHGLCEDCLEKHYPQLSETLADSNP